MCVVQARWATMCRWRACRSRTRVSSTISSSCSRKSPTRQLTRSARRLSCHWCVISTIQRNMIVNSYCSATAACIAHALCVCVGVSGGTGSEHPGADCRAVRAPLAQTAHPVAQGRQGPEDDGVPRLANQGHRHGLPG